MTKAILRKHVYLTELNLTETCLFFYNFQYLAIWINFRVHFFKWWNKRCLCFNFWHFVFSKITFLKNAIKLWFCTSSSVNRVICYNIKCDNLMISNPKNLVNRVTQFYLKTWLTHLDDCFCWFIQVYIYASWIQDRCVRLLYLIIYFLNKDTLWGSTVVWWLALVPHSKIVLGLNPPAGSGLFSSVCGDSLRVLQLPPTVQRHAWG